MLSHVKFTHFKCLFDVTVPLERLTVLVGKNGSGKTSVLQGLHLLARVAFRHGAADTLEGQASEAFSGRFDPHRVASHFQLEGREPVQAPEVSVSVTGLDGSTCAVTLDVRDPAKAHVHVDASPPGPNLWQRNHSLRPDATAVVSALYLKLDAEAASRPSVGAGGASDNPRVEDVGDGLPTVLNYLAGAHPEALDAIVADLARVVPGVRGIRTLPATVTLERRQRISFDDSPPLERLLKTSFPGHKFELRLKDLGAIPADLLSEGTILTLALLTVLHDPQRQPSLLLLDDLDAALHPEALKPLVDNIRRILDQRPGLQILATCHSPYLLDHFEANEVVALAVGPFGRTSAARLSDHPDWESRWKASIRPGEFWGSVGEEWVLQPRLPA